MTNSSNASLSVADIIDRANDLRADRPIIWAILRGRGGDLRIAQLTGMTLKQVQTDAAVEQKQGAIKRTQNNTWSLDPKYSAYPVYLKVRKYYQLVDMKLVEAHPFDVELSELCSTARQRARELRADTEARPEKSKAAQPTETQGILLRAIVKAGLPGKGGAEHFSAMEIAKAQGRANVGWTNKYMETLARRGFAEDVRIGARRYWKLTALGLEWANTDPSEEA